MARMSKAKKQILKFIKHAYNEDFVFTIEGGFNDARKFLHRMRTELSRLRDLGIKQGRTPKRWKMIVKSLNKCEDGIQITLVKTYNADPEISSEVQEALDAMTEDRADRADRADQEDQKNV